MSWPRSTPTRIRQWYWTAWEGVTYPVEVTFKTAEKGGYMASNIMHDLQRTNDRADYPDLSDAEFGNFRNIATTGMGKRCAVPWLLPINPELGRNTYVDAALKQAGVNVIMNLANSPEEAEAYEGFADTYYSGQKVIYLNLGVDFSARSSRRVWPRACGSSPPTRVPTMSTAPRARTVPASSPLCWSA